MRTLDLDQAAKLLHLHPDTLQQRAKAGDIPAAKPGKRWVFVEDDLLDWLRGQYVGKNGEGKRCSGSVATFGGLTSSTLDAEFDALVGRRTGRKPRSGTTDSRRSSGNRPNSGNPRI
jgi:excisionase family DNA binding protein